MCSWNFARKSLIYVRKICCVDRQVAFLSVAAKKSIELMKKHIFLRKILIEWMRFILFNEVKQNGLVENISFSAVNGEDWKTFYLTVKFVNWFKNRWSGSGFTTNIQLTRQPEQRVQLRAARQLILSFLQVGSNFVYSEDSTRTIVLTKMECRLL